MMLQLLQVITFVLSIIISGNFVFMSHGSYCYDKSSFNTSCGGDYGLPIEYPFWISSGFGNPDNPDCKPYPGFAVRCEGTKPVMNISNHRYYVKGMESNSNSQIITVNPQTITLMDVDVDGEECPRPRHNFSLQSQPFLNYYDSDSLTVFYNCTIAPPTSGEIRCLENSYNNKTRRSYAFQTYEKGYLIPEGFHDWYNYCEESVAVPANYYRDSNAFTLTWSSPVDCDDCVYRGGQCSANDTTGGGIRCQCANGTTVENDICTDPQGAQGAPVPQAPQGVQEARPQGTQARQ